MKKDLGDAPLTLGGWLILVGIRLVVGLVMNCNYVTKIISLDLNALGQIIRILTFLIILYMFIVASLFLKRHKAFPATYIALEACSIILNISTFITSNNVRDAFSIACFAALLLISTLWILYMLLSKRVKKTFVCRWNETLDQNLVDKANGMEANR